MKEIKQIRIALANLEPLLDLFINQSEQLHEQYNKVCLERDNLKKLIDLLNSEINKLKNDKHNIDDKKS